MKHIICCVMKHEKKSKVKVLIGYLPYKSFIAANIQKISQAARCISYKTLVRTLAVMFVWLFHTRCCYCAIFSNMFGICIMLYNA